MEIINSLTNEEREAIARIYRTKLRKYQSVPEWLKETLWEEAKREYFMIQDINRRGGTGYESKA